MYDLTIIWFINVYTGVKYMRLTEWFHLLTILFCAYGKYCQLQTLAFIGITYKNTTVMTKMYQDVWINTQCNGVYYNNYNLG